MIIRKYPETMTPRERVRRTFSFETTDRVTIGYETTPVENVVAMYNAAHKYGRY